MRIEFEEGTIYEGTIKNGKPHGKGLMTYADGKTYNGLWKNGEYKLGTLTNPDKSSYSGEWKNGLPHGEGTMSYPEGHESHFYKGDWKTGLYHGSGNHVLSNGVCYVGAFRMGKRHGKGELIFPDKKSRSKIPPPEFSVKGTFSNGELLLDKVRILFNKSNNIYEGSINPDFSFVRGKLNIPGEMKVYTGEFKNSKFHGKGTIEFLKEREKYEGDWEDGVMHGEGIYYFKNGEKYTGSFVNGKMRGHGTTVFPNGDRYVHETAEDGSKAGDYYAAGSKNSVYTRYDSNGIITN